MKGKGLTRREFVRGTALTGAGLVAAALLVTDGFLTRARRADILHRTVGALRRNRNGVTERDRGQHHNAKQ